MLVRRCCLTRPDDLVGLRGVEHVEFPRDINRLKRGYAVRSIDAIAHSDQLPLHQAHAPNARPHRTGRTPPALPALGDPGVSRNLVRDLPHGGFWAYLGCILHRALPETQVRTDLPAVIAD